jgi:O-methyltransferase
MIKKYLKNIINKIGYDLKKIDKEFHNKYILLPKDGLTFSEDLLYTYHNADFTKDPLFIESYQLGKDTDTEGILLKDYDIRWRIHVLCWAAYHAIHLDGDFVDCGVNTGIFSRAIINFVDFNKTCKKYYLLDTFQGLDSAYSTHTEMLRNDMYGYANQFHLYEQVKETFKNFNVEIIKGSVPDTLPLVKSKKICFLSIDMNCVEPEIKALEFFWDKMVSGGIIMLDDYGYANSTNDQKTAHDQFAKSHGVMVLSLPTCQGMIVKP